MGVYVSVTYKKKKRKLAVKRKRSLETDVKIDYKNVDVLKRFITDRGKIIPRRVSGATQAQQRLITTAVNRARYLALIPFTTAHETERGFSGEMQAVSQAMGTPFRTRRPAPQQNKTDAAKTTVSTVKNSASET